MIRKTRPTAGKLAALMAPYRGAVPTVDPLRDRGALSARIAAAGAGMTLESHREHCRGIVRAHRWDVEMAAHRTGLAADIAAGGTR